MASFVLRHIDERLWAHFRAQAAADGIHPMQLIFRLMQAHVNGTQRRAQALAVELADLHAHADHDDPDSHNTTFETKTMELVRALLKET